ncbi:MAG: hypothetical protein DI629_03500 [Mesorhizobium amorphae]|nr:MAG: hypothetical protein DI629_03500 [Mesorhizobium amorphae]
MTEKPERKGRGRLSGIEQLPEEAGEIIATAAAALHDRSRTQLEIYQEFHAALETLRRESRGELDFQIPSLSAFNRYSIRLATLTRRLEQTREIADAIAQRFGSETSDNLTIFAAEMIKSLVLELLERGGEAGFTPKDALELAGALRAAAQAQGVSTARREKLEKDLKKEVGAAVDQVAKVKGITAETAEAIKAQILGVRA